MLLFPETVIHWLCFRAGVGRQLCHEPAGINFVRLEYSHIEFWPGCVRIKEIMWIRIQINEIQNRKIMKKIKKTKSLSLEEP